MCVCVYEVSSKEKSQFEGLWHGGSGEKALRNMDRSLQFPSAVLCLAVAAAAWWVIRRWDTPGARSTKRGHGAQCPAQGLAGGTSSTMPAPLLYSCPWWQSRWPHTHGMSRGSAEDVRRMQPRCELQPCCVRLGSSLKPPHGSAFKGQAFFWSVNYPYVKLVWMKGEKGTWKYSDNKGCGFACRCTGCLVGLLPYCWAEITLVHLLLRNTEGEGW